MRARDGWTKTRSTLARWKRKEDVPVRGLSCSNDTPPQGEGFYLTRSAMHFSGLDSFDSAPWLLAPEGVLSELVSWRGVKEEASVGARWGTRCRRAMELTQSMAGRVVCPDGASSRARSRGTASIRGRLLSKPNGPSWKCRYLKFDLRSPNTGPRGVLL